MAGIGIAEAADQVTARGKKKTAEAPICRIWNEIPQARPKKAKTFV
jgi:hypothetical protein